MINNMNLIFVNVKNSLMKKTKSFLGGSILVLAFMFIANVSFGQGDAPVYSQSTYQSYIQNLKSGLQTIVLDRMV